MSSRVFGQTLASSVIPGFVASVALVGCEAPIEVDDDGVADGDGSSGSYDDDAAADEDTDDAPSELLPRLDGISPADGPFGTEVVLTGRNLRGAVDGEEWPLDLQLSFASAELESVVAADDPSVTEWTETTIRVRWPYPFDGAVVVETHWGAASIDGFTPSWRASPSWRSLESYRVTSVQLGEGSIAMIAGSDGHLIHVREDSVDDHALGGAVSQAALFDDGQSRPAGFVLRPLADSRALLELRWRGDVLDVLDTGFATPVDDAMLAAGRDDQGVYAWIRDPATRDYHRVRASASGWSIDKGPIPGPTSTDRAAHFGLAGPDGALVLSWADETCEGIFGCNSYNGYVAEIAADGTAFGPAEQVFTGEVDRTRTRLAADGRLFFAACTDKVYDWWNGAEGCVTRMRQVDGAWMDLQLPAGGDITLAHEFAPAPDGAVVAAYCTTDDELRITTDARGIDFEVARWPCGTGPGRILGDLWVDDDGTPRLLTQWREDLWHTLAPRE